jgi:hypothetical protein
MMRTAKIQTEQLLLICNEIIADGVITKDEVHKLKFWLNDNKSALQSWPGSLIAEHVNSILADGEIEDAERESLFELLSSVLEGNLRRGELTSQGLRLNLDIPSPSISFRDKAFFFVGKFHFGSLKKCQAAILSLNRSCANTPSGEIDYVVVGAQTPAVLQSPTNQARIQKLLLLQKRGYKFSVISEESWSTAASQSIEPQDSLTEQDDRRLQLAHGSIVSPSNYANAKGLLSVTPTPLSLALPVDTDECAREISIESSSNDQCYVVDLSKHTCNCPDFTKKRTLFPSNDIRRACKHICLAIARRRLLDRVDTLSSALISECVQSGCGFPCDGPVLWFEIEGDPIVFSFGNSEWLNIFAIARGKHREFKFDRFGYNFIERRWSYGISPKNSLKIREIIHKHINAKAAQATKEKNPGCFFASDWNYRLRDFCPLYLLCSFLSVKTNTQEYYPHTKRGIAISALITHAPVNSPPAPLAPSPPPILASTPPPPALCPGSGLLIPVLNSPSTTPHTPPRSSPPPPAPACAAWHPPHWPPNASR